MSEDPFDISNWSGKTYAIDREVWDKAVAVAKAVEAKKIAEGQFDLEEWTGKASS